jgi:teichuronic acid exporter
MRFRLLALIDGLQSVVQAISTLALAFLGFGYWALVLGYLSVGIVSTALTLIWRRQRFGWPRISFLREPLAFSVHLLLGTLGWYTYDNSDFLIAGKVLGSSPLGAYTLAWTLAHAPLDKLTTIANRVTPSIFSAAQKDFDALRRYLRNISGTLSLVVFPAVLGITLVAKDFVLVALGQKWIGVVLPLELLTLHALFRSNVILLTPLLNVIGEERFAMWNSLLALAVLLPSFYVGSRWGTGGIAGAWVLIYPFVALPLFWRLFRRIEMPVGEYLGALWPAISACILMATAVELFKYLRSPEWPLFLDLVLEMLIGATVYVLALVLVHRSRLCAILSLIKNLRSQAA